MQKLKEIWQNMQAGTKRLLIIIVSVTVIAVIAAVTWLRVSENSNYSALFTNLNQEEAQEIVSVLQADGMSSYQYNANTGTIFVPTSQVEQLRVELLGMGYPQSGFAYDWYVNNAGMMTTESDKKQYSLYDLQDRLGATIRLFDGVQDARVTIATAEDSIYALSNSSGIEASASVVVTMRSGSTLTVDKATAVKNLIAHAVRGMNFTNVKVFDAATMTEVGGSGSEDSYSSGEDALSLTTMVEQHIANNIRKLLEKLYGEGNVVISVKGTLNMERLIQESVVYTVPDQVDEEDREGLLSYEQTYGENSGTSTTGDGGEAGADANADTPDYTYEDGDGNQVDTYSNSSATREWLYNILTEQREIEPGYLVDTTVGIVINTDSTDILMEDLIDLVANASGIALEDAAAKIKIIRAPGIEPDEGPTIPVDVPEDPEEEIPLVLVIALAASVALLLLIILLMLILRRKKRKTEEDEELDLTTEPFDLGQGEPVSDAVGAEVKALEEEDSEMAKNEEILNLRMQRNVKLKQNIGEFVDQNPQVAAKLLQGWLRGEGEDNGGKRG